MKRLPAFTLLVAALSTVCIGLGTMAAVLGARVVGLQRGAGSARAEKAAGRELAAQVARRPEDPVARQRLAAYLDKRGEIEAAEEQMAAAQSLAPDDAALAVDMGRLYLRAGKSMRALAPLESAALKSPTDAAARAWLGLAYLESGEPEAARGELEAAARLNASLPEAHLGLALLSIGRGDGSRAREEVGEYLRLSEGAGTGPALLSRVYRELGEVPRAIGAGRLAVAQGAVEPNAWLALGLALGEGSTRERAEGGLCLERAVQLAPRSPGAHVGLGRAYLRQLRYADAASEFDRGASLGATGERLSRDRSRAYQGSGRKDEARELIQAAARDRALRRRASDLQQAIARRPQYVDLYGQLAQLRAGMGAYELAAVALEKARRLRPDDPTLGRALRLMREMGRE
jgi:tetratricopeptide (TPR) repeat protein